MGIRHIIYTVLAVFLFLQGCAPIYVPNASHSHLLDKKKEFNANARAGTNGFDLHGAYAFSDNLGVVGGASFGSQEVTHSDGSVNEDFHEHTYGELGMTYFRPFGKIGRFELLGGLGFGSSSSVDDFDFLNLNQGEEVRTTGKYNKVFGQSNIGIETGFVEAGLAVRLAQITFTEFETNSQIITEAESGTFFEPAAFARFGSNNFQVEAQYGVATPLNRDELPFSFEPFWLSVGVNINLKP